MVPTRKNAPARLLKEIELETTNPRLFVQRRGGSPAAAPVWTPARTPLPDQALKLIPKPYRAEIVHRREEQKSKDDRQSTAECPLERLSAERTPPDSLDGIEKQMASIQHRDWQEVDESEIN